MRFHVPTIAPLHAHHKEQVQNRALVLESDPDVANVLVQHLRTSSSVSRVDHAADGPSGVAMAESFEYRLICLELVMPKLGGPDLCKTLRAARVEAALLAVTACAEAASSLLGTEAGIDDYIVKPIEPHELVRKAEVLISRPTVGAARNSAYLRDDFSVAGLSIFPSMKGVIVEGRLVTNLSPAEFELICFLARQAGDSLSEEEILASLWGLHPPVNLRSLGVNLRQLGMKLRGRLTGHRYLSFGRGRVRFDAGGTLKGHLW